MPPRPHALSVLLARELDAFAREVDAFPDDERLWQTVPGISNSCGNLALHAAGNLEHFVGAILGGTGYVRNRDEEFSRRSGTRAELVAGLARAREVVTHVLDALPAEAWEREYPEPVGGVRLPTGTVLLHLLSHLAHHLGQAGYLRRVLTGENRSVTSSALADLGARLEAARGR